MHTNMDIRPFENFLPLDGYHCQTNSLAKIFHHYYHPLSEDMILGLGAGMGFIYWKMKMRSSVYVFIGGRGNIKDFFNDLGKRTGVKMRVVTTTSSKRAEASLLERLERREPVILFGDMGFLPWFDLPQEYHFGGHTFVICGYDGNNGVLASDLEQKAANLKKGFYCPITLEQLSKARSSTYKPFPPRNAYLEFDFSTYQQPEVKDIYAAIKQTSETMLNPPIKNIGVKGMRHAAKELLKWPEMFEENDLRMNLFSIYIFVEIGGTGGGCFRYMYSRFLEESAKITKNDELLRSAERLRKAGEIFSEIGLLFKESKKADDLDKRIGKASDMFHAVADIEENAYTVLAKSIQW